MQHAEHRVDGDTSLPTLRAIFRERYLSEARFREDGDLADALAQEAEPVLEVLATALRPGIGEPALHEGYALLTLLSRHAAGLGATPGAALAVASALAAAVRRHGGQIDRAREDELALVVMEGYCAARDERATKLLREANAERQVAVELGRGCHAIFLAGSHQEADLVPTLERFARDLLHAETRSCLLDVSRLSPLDDDLARALGHFCAQAATLGVCSFVTGAPARLRDQFERWSIVGGRPGDRPTMLVDDFVEARDLALAAAGLQVRERAPWSRWFLPSRWSLVR
jgi:hypothetical protein